MSDTQNSPLWETVKPTKPNHEPEVQFLGWLGWEDRFGEYGEPGFSRFVRPTVASEFFGHGEPVDLTFTLYRGEDGLLLGIHAVYINEEGMNRVFMMSVHPDHRRKGIATKMAKHLEQIFIQEKSAQFGMTPEEFISMPDIERAKLVVPKLFVASEINTTPSMAGFLNKTASTMLDGTFEVSRDAINNNEGVVSE